MKYVKISHLKKMAKKLRKNNDNVKNQAESLNLIAKENNKASWQDLINDSVLLLESEQTVPMDSKEEASITSKENNDMNFVFSEKVITMFGMMVSSQFVKIRSGTRIRLDIDDSHIERVHAIYNMADLLHNVGSLLTIRNKKMLRLHVQHHKDYFESILGDEKLKKETEIDMAYDLKLKDQLVAHQYWLKLFDLMLKEIDGDS